MKRFVRQIFLLALCALVWPAGRALAQGVTTGAITGVVKDAQGQGVAGASILAVHVPSGSQYGALSRADGRYTIANMRVGGPYRVTVSHIGFEAPAKTGVTVNLGSATEVNFDVRERAVEIAGVTATASASPILQPTRTGASTAIQQQALQSLPTVSRRIEDFARLSPQYGGNYSFAGQDNRMNNMTIDGSYFNNSFGLAGQPGDRTGVAPISVDALEQVSVNIAPFDVRQGNFVGASINTVTRSGGNEFKGSVYYMLRNQDLVGTKAGDLTFNPGTFKFHNLGGWVSGPIIKNKLFFVGSYEDESTNQPATTFVANKGTETVTGNTTRVLASDLDALSTFLKTNFNYDTGPYQDYPFLTPAKRYLAKLDYNLSKNSKASLRYTDLESSTDVLESNSSSLGFGNRRTSLQSLNFANSNYSILENIRSVVGEVNSTIGTNKSNNFIIGYTYQDESRGYKSSLFPLVDIQSGGSTYTSFGFEPFTPNNQLRYKTGQLQDNFSIYGEKHSFTFGVTAEKYHSINVFYPGSQGAYTYSSLQDFYTDANAFLNNADCKTDALSAACLNRQSPVTIRRFQVRWNNVPGSDEPVQPLDVFYAGAYAQDQWQVNPKLNLTLGVRFDVPKFGNTGYDNPAADQLTFLDENYNPVKYNTGKLPDARLHWSPRLGFNYDLTGDRSTQIRGGTGVFTGPPAYVWISNQIGNTGMLTGFEQLDNTKARPFNPNPNAYHQAASTAPPASYELAVTDPNFKFPQTWRSDLAVDKRLPFGLIGTAEFIYSKDINGIYYINANLPKAQTTYTAGPDKRMRWTSNRIFSNVTDNTVLKNQNVGWSYDASASLEKTFSMGLYVKAAYRYGVAKNTVDPGSIAFGSWQNNPTPGDPNNPGLGYGTNSPGKRVFVSASYRRNIFSIGETQLSLFWEGHTQGNTSYIFNGDANGDGNTANDLIYIPKDATEMNFEQYTFTNSTTKVVTTFTTAQQQAAWEAFIQQDKYLSKHRGEYAVRGAVFLPMVFRADAAIAQEIARNVGGARNAFQVRADILNIGNMINHNWGVGQRMVTTSPLTSPKLGANGAMTYRLRNLNEQLITSTLQPSSSVSDVYRIQFSLRYTFN